MVAAAAGKKTRTSRACVHKLIPITCARIHPVTTDVCIHARRDKHKTRDWEEQGSVGC